MVCRVIKVFSYMHKCFRPLIYAVSEKELCDRETNRSYTNTVQSNETKPIITKTSMRVYVFYIYDINYSSILSCVLFYLYLT